MKGNKITEWSYELPTESGLYLLCHGDIEVSENIEPVRLRTNLGRLTFSDDGMPVESCKRGCKWARLLTGSDAK